MCCTYFDCRKFSAAMSKIFLETLNICRKYSSNLVKMLSKIFDKIFCRKFSCHTDLKKCRRFSVVQGKICRKNWCRNKDSAPQPATERFQRESSVRSNLTDFLAIGSLPGRQATDEARQNRKLVSPVRGGCNRNPTKRLPFFIVTEHRAAFRVKGNS